MSNVPAPPVEEEDEAYDVTSELLNELLDDATNNTKPPKKNAVKILVGSIFWDGLWAFHVTPEMKIHRIKMLALFELYGSDFDGLSGSYIINFPKRRKSLGDGKSVKDEHLEENDELQMIQIPSNDDNTFRAQFENFEHHISDLAINKYTAHLPPPIIKPKTCNVILEIQGPEFMCDVRKIMITLIEYSLTLMSIKPNAKYIFDVVRRKLLSENFFINNDMVSKYNTQGSNARRIKFAISASYNDSFSVNEWLEETRSIDSNILGVPSSFHVDDSKTIETELQELLVLFHQYLKASFKLSPQAVEHLIEMGFDELETKKALRYTGNSIQESVEYLIGNTDLANDGAKPGLHTGMSKTCDMYNHIMKEEEIILPLSTPSVLYACLSVMDGNAFLVSSIRFPALMTTLNKILSIYYVNKCDMAMKQMLGHRPND